MAKKTTPATRLSNFKIESIPVSENRFCGPAAMSAITGENPDACARVLAAVINRTRGLWVNRTGKGVGGTTPREVALALNKFGYGIDNSGLRTGKRIAQPWERESFKAWAKRTESERGDRVFLVNAGRHWRVVHRWQTVCGIKRTPHHTNCATSPTSKVRDVYEVVAWS